MHMDKAEEVLTARRVDRSLSGNFSSMLFIRSAANFRALVSMAAIATCSMMSHTASDDMHDPQEVSSYWKVILLYKESCSIFKACCGQEGRCLVRKCQQAR